MIIRTITYSALCAEHRVESHAHDIDGDALVTIAAGWTADDGNAAVHFPGATCGLEAADEYVTDGDWGDRAATRWASIDAWRIAHTLDRTGERVTLEIDRESHTVAIEATEPACADGRAHYWTEPHEIVGGMSESPGIRGHGGGVCVTSICQHCGIYRTIDTWAQCQSTGEQGLTSVIYSPADRESRDWVDSLAAVE